MGSDERTDRAALGDGPLLECFIASRDEDAFAVLVERHAALVWGVCRRVLRNPQDAEDAFQATFLVLARKAASVAPREMVANWLYGVARRTARNAGAAVAERRVRERQVTEFPEPAVEGHDLWPDLRPLLDRELSRLPDRYRVSVVLCDLEGLTREEAARRLGLPEGTVASRLARARALLAKRLARYGLVVSAGALAAALSAGRVSASVPAGLVPSAVTIASGFAAGGAAVAGGLSPAVATLTQGVLRTMFITKLKAATWLVLAGAGLLGGGWFLYAAAGPKPAAAPTDRDKIQGTWTAESIKDGGKERTPDNPRVVITRDRLTIQSGDTVKAEATYELDPSKTPKWIDFRDGGRTMLGIYELDGDTLKVCLNEVDRGDRPTKFVSEADSPNDLLLVLRREK